ncbi:DUF6095 family protein [Mesonia maritima]|uniref:Na+/melibiose symporter-like transporter n=1 Tax=Mesonia maritima TaxID=1793873 RepID=A0ABU1K404_9FLAO|nr:DUF6095 family protein [Mesonia maritima]MDR6300349.1 Na+/melibiose symporter-like transporter [Mesonia maritima]
MKRTNKQVLYKGLQYLAGALPLILIGPSVLYSAFGNKNHPLFLAVLILGIVACAAAIFCMFKGIKIILRAVFDE